MNGKEGIGLVDHDWFGDHYRDFQRDIYLLILSFIRAATQHFVTSAHVELSHLEPALTDADAELAEHLEHERQMIIGDNADQSTFICNLALVALSSRLLYRLRVMADSADLFCPRTGTYGLSKQSEYRRIFEEYRQRFGINLLHEEKHRVQFVYGMNAVRNRIVHHGGMANSYKAFSNTDPLNVDDDILDYSFSQRNPEYVVGEGGSAEVRVTKEQLEHTARKACELVEYLNERLRALQLIYLNEQGYTTVAN